MIVKKLALETLEQIRMKMIQEIDLERLKTYKQFFQVVRILDAIQGKIEQEEPIEQDIKVLRKHLYRVLHAKWVKTQLYTLITC